MAVKLYSVDNGTLIIGEYNEESIHLLDFQFDGTILTITRKYIKDINGNNAIVFCEEANLLDQNDNPVVDPVQYINDIWNDADDIDNEDLEQLILDHINDLNNPHQIPSASTTVRGIVELATEVETIGGTPDRVVTADHLQTVLGNILTTTNKGYTDDIIGDDVTTAFITTHNLGSKNVQVTYYDTTSNNTVYVDTERTTINTVTSTFAVAPATGQDYRVLITEIVDS